MSSAAASVLSSNVIPVEFRATPSVVVNFDAASRPVSEIAQRVASQAGQKVADAENSMRKKDGTLRQLSNTRTDVFMMNPYLMSVKPGWNCRDLSNPVNLAHIDETARSIASVGVKQPLFVMLEGKTMFVTDGHIRLLATFRAIEVYGAEIMGVPVMMDTATGEADRKANQIIRNGGLRPGVLERGKVFVELRDFGWSPEQTATKMGISTVRVTQVLDLMDNANDAIKSMVSSGKVAPAMAALALKNAGGDSAEAERALGAAVEVAVAEGKQKATPKHFKRTQPEGTLTTKAALRAIFDRATTDVETGRARVTVTMTAADWKELTRVLDI